MFTQPLTGGGTSDRPRFRSMVAAIVGLLLSALALTACGADGDDDAGAGGGDGRCP